MVVRLGGLATNPLDAHRRTRLASTQGQIDKNPDSFGIIEKPATADDERVLGTEFVAPRSMLYTSTAGRLLGALM